MKTLFDILDGIFSSAEKDEYLSSPDSIISYAELTMGVSIEQDFAESIIRVGKKWIDSVNNGNGEWSRMREEAKELLKCYLHINSGDVATVEMWKSDYESMSAEIWFGLRPYYDDLHWLDDAGLVEVAWNVSELVEV